MSRKNLPSREDLVEQIKRLEASVEQQKGFTDAALYLAKKAEKMLEKATKELVGKCPIEITHAERCPQDMLRRSGNAVRDECQKCWKQALASDHLEKAVES